MLATSDRPAQTAHVADEHGLLGRVMHHLAVFAPLAGRTVPDCSRRIINARRADDECRTLAGWAVQLLPLRSTAPSWQVHEGPMLLTLTLARTAHSRWHGAQHQLFGMQERKMNVLLGLQSRPAVAAALWRQAPAAELPSLRRQRVSGTPCLGICACEQNLHVLRCTRPTEQIPTVLCSAAGSS